MFDRMTQSPPAQGADVIARAVAALALAALAVIPVVGLPATLGPTPLVGAGDLGIIAAAGLTGRVVITRAAWLGGGAAGGAARGAPCGRPASPAPAGGRPRD